MIKDSSSSMKNINLKSSSTKKVELSHNKSIVGSEPTQMSEQGFKHSIFGGLRIVIRKDEPWFIYSQVSKILELHKDIWYYGNGKGKKSKYFKDDPPERSLRYNMIKEGVDSIHIIDAIGRKQVTIIINEINLYRMVFASKKPNALDFQKWVLGEVLPSIRKTGKYVEGEQENGCFSIQEFADHFCNHSPLKLGQNKVFEILRDNGVLTKNNLPYRQYIEEGTLSTSVSVSPLGHKSYRTIITPKGIAKILKIVSEHYLDEPKNDFNPNQYMIDFETGTTILRGTFEALKYRES